MEIKEYAKTSKIPLKTLRWMERIKTTSDPLTDNDLIGLKLLEKLWGMHDFLRPQITKKGKKDKEALFDTCDLETKWERYAYSRFMNMEPGKRLSMKVLLTEIELTYRFKLSDFDIRKLYRVRKRVHRAKERQVKTEQKEEQKKGIAMPNNDLEKSEKKLQNDHEKMRQSLKQIKRNSSFFNATGMMTQAKKQIQKIILIVGTCFMLTSPAFGLEIRQDFYNYPLVINTPVEIPIHQTFIIARQPSFYARPESRRPERRSFSVVFFDLGSAWLSPDASNKLLMELRECCVACPLYITGYTCSIGIESQNLELSRSRAEVVATMLRRNGYKVASAEGKGMIYGSTLESNRKVEIKLAK